MKFIVRENQRALLFKNGQLDRVYGPGSHRVVAPFAEIDIQYIDVDRGYTVMTPELEQLVSRSDAAPFVVPADKVGCISIDGVATTVVRPGRYLLWQARAGATGRLISTDELVTDVPSAFRSLLPSDLFCDVNITRYERALVYVDGSLEMVLDGGRTVLSRANRTVTVEYVDTREQELQIVGQEVMTSDKVTLRVNVIATYRVVDAVRATERVDDVFRALYSEAQMATRRFVAGRTVEALLESRNEAAEQMAEDVGRRAREWGVEVLRVDLKDVVLPGEMKTILNRVIEAQKKAEANVILRREETAATRSLANTAKMLEQNPMLLRLKELEAYKEMLADIDNVTLVAGGDAVTGLLTK